MSDDAKPTIDYKQGDLCHLEIPVNDKARAKAFYGEVFGWQFQEVPEMDYTLFTTPGKVVGGGLFTPSEQQPAKVINYMLVDSIEKTAEKVKAFGGQTVGPRIDVGGQGAFMHIIDSEGNLIALWESTKR